MISVPSTEFRNSLNRAPNAYLICRYRGTDTFRYFDADISERLLHGVDSV